MLDLYHSDCVAGMAKLPERSVDVVVTSPPYNIGTQYSMYNDVRTKRDYLDWTAKWVAAVSRVLRLDGSFSLNIAGKPTDRTIPHDVLQIVLYTFRLQNEIHWIKSIALDGEDLGVAQNRPEGLSVGHYKPINSPRFVNDCHEYIFHLTLRGDVPLDRLAIGVPYADKTNTQRWSDGRDLRCRGNTWFLPYPTINKNRPHPAVFPVKLAEHCIRLHGLERTHLVLDPFMGIGNTAVACARLGVDCIGFEIDEGYLEEAWRHVTEID